MARRRGAAAPAAGVGQLDQAAPAVVRGELRGKRAICDYTQRGWQTLLLLQRQRGFPMALVGGVWCSTTQLIDAWHRRQLRRR